MHKFTAAVVFALTMLFAADTLAGVRFIVDSAQHTKRDRSKNNHVSPSLKNCQIGGYTKVRCTDGEYGVDLCPYDSRYFKYCCPETHVYTREECKDMGMRPGSSCHGYYACEEDSSAVNEDGIRNKKY